MRSVTLRLLKNGKLGLRFYHSPESAQVLEKVFSLVLQHRKRWQDKQLWLSKKRLSKLPSVVPRLSCFQVKPIFGSFVCQLFETGSCCVPKSGQKSSSSHVSLPNANITDKHILNYFGFKRLECFQISYCETQSKVHICG